MGTYNSDPYVQTMANGLTQDASLKSQIWVRSLMLGAQANDDFSILEGPDEGDKPVYVRNDLTKDGGDKMVFTVMGGLAGPGVRGEAELTGNTSKANFKTFSLTVDYWRDGFELNKKILKFMAAGGQLPSRASQILRSKLGLQKQRDAMMALRSKAVGNVIRPNGRSSRDTIVADDLLTPDYVVWAKAQAARLGARPINVSKDKNGSQLQRFLCFATESAMLGVRQDSDYLAACTNAANRGEDNPLFSGRLVDWNNIAFFEHFVVDPPVQDTIGSPLSPRVVTNLAFSIASSAGDCRIQAWSAAEASADAKVAGRLFTQDFPGYAYRWWEGADGALSSDSAKYYAWGITPAGRVGFVEYTGSGNTGSLITVDKILAGKDLAADGSGSGGTSTKGYKTVGTLTTGTDSTTSSHVITLGTATNLPATFTYTDEFPVGTVFLAANANGALIGHSFLLGRGALCRGYGSVRELPTEELRDFGFVNGWGYESIFGQAPYTDANGRTSNYTLLEHAITVPGYEVPEKIHA